MHRTRVHWTAGDTPGALNCGDYVAGNNADFDLSHHSEE